jgi:hypothetical protein
VTLDDLSQFLIGYQTQSPATNNWLNGDFDYSGTVTLDDFWAGWGVRSRGVAQYNRWLAELGPELMKLRWRDAYSVHAQDGIRYRTSVQQGCEPGGFNEYTDLIDTTAMRRLPVEEIITEVTARSPAGVLDPDTATYVELGLFDRKPGKRQVDATTWIAEPMLDTQHVFVVNRRIFEPTDDIPAGARRDTMLALAGTRTIGLRLGLMTGDQ